MENWRQQPWVFLTFIAPGALWLLLFFLIPLGWIWLFAVGERQGPVDIVVTWTMSNYAEALQPIYLQLFFKTLWIAILSTVVCLVVAFPVALSICFAPERYKNILLLLVILPFWTNMLIRTYAMIAMLRQNGFLNDGIRGVWTAIKFLLTPVGLGGLMGDQFQPLNLLYNNAAVILGTVYVYLPFMVLPLYANLEKLDRSLIEASLDLGASQVRTFFEVIVKLAKPGIISGVILVFIPALGTFLISDLLGGPDSQLIGNVIERQFRAANNLPLGAALSFMLLYLTFIALALRAWFAARGERSDA
ncbi:MAG TPA: ABC transporter permease [Geminicoccus sp.]|uniref:ABC transporter permease n=1 Tax=Geminicoccus sp. TaxID=2024832 RepID=UPI002E3391E9|nr:ABC transporter permease [Geminicoccus sp.]HEX2525380.1 ABC transporter permease [Geminicoccus sp.]